MWLGVSLAAVRPVGLDRGPFPSDGVAWDADMGTGTLFGQKDKAAASCRTPNASRLPAPTASAGAIWGQARCLGRKTKRQQAAALQALRAYKRALHVR